MTGRTPTGGAFPAHLSMRRHLRRAAGNGSARWACSATSPSRWRRSGGSSSGRSWPRSARWRPASPTRSATRSAGIKMATNLLSSPRGRPEPPLPGDGAVDPVRHRGDRGASSTACSTSRGRPGSSAASTSCSAILDPVVEATAAEGAGARGQVGYGRVEPDVLAAVDGQKLRQVFANVMKNAVEAIDPRRPGGRVEVEPVRRARPRGGRGGGQRRWASRPRIATGSSCRSSPPSPRAPASACPSSRRSWTCTAATSPSRARPARGTRVRISLPAACARAP